MKHIIVIGVLLILPVIAYSQDNRDSEYIWQLKINEARIIAKRPMKEIGMQRTSFDSLQLKENISLSIADVLTYNAPVFVKSYGRATLSTIAFRGTSASHTQVTWNDMKINNPMLGMTDFSTIPAYFIDDAALLHGTSSINETGGGLGGVVKLSTKPAQQEGLGIQFIQGIGSFSTYDEFLRLSWGNDKWQTSTRLVYSFSENDYKYLNHDKKENIYDQNHKIIGQYYPIEKNKSGSFKDFHFLQEVYLNAGKGNRIGMNVWYINSNRELPMLTTDYSKDNEFENIQREQTLRSVISWDYIANKWKVGAKAGYMHTMLSYDYKADPGNGIMTSMICSRSRVNTIYGQANAEFSLNEKWYFTTNLSAHQHFVNSIDKNIILQDGDKAVVGYDKARIELSGSISAKWRPIEWMGLSAVLREEVYGNEFTPIIPALFAEFVICNKWNLIAKGSISRNYRFPTLNDMYFMPGGNPNLKSESGFTYDTGLEFEIGKSKKYNLKGGVSWFDSYINDWIIWLPTTKGFFSPRNIKKVHAYGIESNAELQIPLSENLSLNMQGIFSWTPSINEGEPMTPADKSVGKQLPYVPKFSASANGRISWKSWSLLYKWCYYSPRYTMSSNDITLTGELPTYYMNNLTLEKIISTKFMNLSIKGCINNLFNEDYLSVLSRPMPGINFQIFIGIVPLISVAKHKTDKF